MTPEEFKKARNNLGLTISQLASILSVNTRTIQKWEANERDKTARHPNPIAARVVHWMLDGYRPPEWPKDKR